MADRGPVLGRVSLHPYAVPLARPWLCARGATITREGWLVSVEDAEGACGWGECAPLPGAGTESPDEAWQALSAASERLPGLDALRALDALPVNCNFMYIYV